jgi:hypothetical protein
VLPLAIRSPGISLPAAASLLVTGGAADGDYADGASSEGRGGGPGGIDNTHLDDNTLTTAAVAGENHVRLALPMNATSVSNIHFLAANAPLMPPPPLRKGNPPSLNSHDLPVQFSCLTTLCLQIFLFVSPFCSSICLFYCHLVFPSLCFPR